MRTNDWTTEQDDEMRRLISLGWSGPKMAKALGKSKSAVNSRRFRLGLSNKVERKVRNEAQAVQNKMRVGTINFRTMGAEPNEGYKPPRTFDLDDPSRTDGMTVTQGSHGCRWPIGGDGADMLFCCRAKHHRSFCSEHAKRAYTVESATPFQQKRIAREISRRAA